MTNNAASLSAAMPMGATFGSPLGLPAMGMPEVEKPSLGARFVNAVKAAVSELRGTPTAPSAQVGTMQLAASAPLMAPTAGIGPVDAGATAPVTIKRSVSAKGMSLADRKAVMARVAKEQAAAERTGIATGAAAMQQPGAMPTAGTQLPAHATQLPGATVYSYDGNGNPAIAGLQGLSPQMQSQLGLNPTMLGAVNGIANTVDPSGPQTNATNQNNVGTTGMMGASLTPMLGAPVLEQSPGARAAAAAATAPSSQTVANANTNDRSALSQQPYGLGMGYGGYGGVGGMGAYDAGYGSSITGSRSGIGGFFSRLFG